MTRKTFATLFTLLIFTGCSTSDIDGTSYFGAKGSPAFYQTAYKATIEAHKQEVEQRYRDRCIYEGFKVGTEELKVCMRVKKAEAKAARREAFRQTWDGFSWNRGVQPPASADECSDPYWDANIGRMVCY